MTLRIGSLCTGYGGLTLATEEVTGGETVWVSDIDKGARKVLDWWFPGVPNLGDMTTIDWTTVEPVDVLDGGTPCQDLSHAGKRAGMTEGSRSNLWVSMREAIAALRPSLVIWENVGGAYSAGADCELEPDAGLLGDGPGRPALRALGRVLGDLATLGYDAEWHGIRAADVGAPHGRLRVFLIARDTNQPRLEGWGLGRGSSREWPTRAAGREPLLPTPRSSDTNGPGTHGDGGIDLRTTIHLLPTPNPFHAGNTETPDDWRNRRLDVYQRTGTRHGPALSVVAWSVAEGNPLDPDHYMPDNDQEESWESAKTAATKKPNSRSAQTASDQSALPQTPPSSSPPASAATPTTTSGSANKSPTWGKYGPAVTRWEHLTRPAPDPTTPSKKGTPQLSPAFAEWMMGLPNGWITQVPHVTRNEALKLAGNGVVPQQAEAALRIMLDRAGTP